MSGEPKVARWTGLLGIGLSVPGAAIFLLAPIRTPDYADHRTLLIAVAFSAVVGNTLMAGFFVSLAGLVERDALNRLLGRVGVVGMVMQIAIVMAAFGLIATVAWRQPGAELARTLTDLAWVLINLPAGPCTALAIAAFAAALRRCGLFGPGLVAFSAFVAAAHLVVAAAFAREGFLAPQGDIAIVVPTLYVTWIAVVGAVLLRSAR